MLKKLIGDRQFYKKVLALTIPIMIQNGITNFVNMLDNVMIGQVGNAQTTGVAVTNQLIFVFNLCIFGAVSGAGIFGAQFYGNGDTKGLQHTLRFKLLFGILLTLAGIGLFLLWGEPLINLYLKGEGNAAEAAASLDYARQYLHIMLIGLIPYTLVQCYSSTLRETGQTVLPMIAGVAAVGVNLTLNGVLIFGLLGAPKLGVAGAAIATVISRFVELLIVAVWTHTHRRKNPYIIGLYRSLYIPRRLIGQITLKGLPLMLNETFWSLGIATLNQCYSVRGLDVVAANNICQTFSNVFSVAFIAVGMAIGILLGQLLGAGDEEGARDASRKMIFFSLVVSVVIAALYILCTRFIPSFYNTTDQVRELAVWLMRIFALSMPLDAVANATYFTLRSGGKTLVTILFDSCFSWFIQVPTAYILVHFTGLPILAIFAICHGVSVIKSVAGCILVNKGIWIKNIVAEAK